MYSGRLRVHYPANQGQGEDGERGSGQRLVLRTEQDWQRNVEAVEVSDDGTAWDFQLTHVHHHLQCKPCLVAGDQLTWSEGSNLLWIVDADPPQEVYPHFFSGSAGRLSSVQELPSARLSQGHRLRIYIPAGYEENVLKRYPVVYVYDGQNLFFPYEAFLGAEWQLDETLDRLDAMNLIDRTMVVGVYSEDRNRDYTHPGYELYGQALVEEVKAWVDERYRTLPDPSSTAVMGSSLGGVMALHLAWEHPQIFGNAACLSSAFGWNDDLLERVHRDPLAGRENLRIYLDSGWPGDNYEVTLSMAAALIERGFHYGRNLMHLAFPQGRHNESAWGSRVHLPIQLFSGKIRRLAEARREREVPPPQPPG
ncbi:MAG: alpha/beta hydrolase-fold protein [Acidobacteriota bacterium]|nr:alpha/beta hydrolase-fold protein [Acidobacteriota bacterium]